MNSIDLMKLIMALATLFAIHTERAIIRYDVEKYEWF